MTTIDQQDLDSVDLADPAVWDDGPPYRAVRQNAARGAGALQSAAQPAGRRSDSGRSLALMMCAP